MVIASISKTHKCHFKQENAIIVHGSNPVAINPVATHKHPKNAPSLPVNFSIPASEIALLPEAHLVSFSAAQNGDSHVALSRLDQYHGNYPWPRGATEKRSQAWGACTAHGVPLFVTKGSRCARFSLPIICLAQIHYPLFHICSIRSVLVPGLVR
eukprot:SAG31_NODE_1685_length_7530_cov_9.464944_3_plen_155_part_00